MTPRGRLAAAVATAALVPVLLAGCSQSPEEKFVDALNEMGEQYAEQADQKQADQRAQADQARDAMTARLAACMDGTGPCADLDLTEDTVTDTDFTGADLTGSRIRVADLAGANFTGADLTRASIYGPPSARLDLTGADFTGATLSDVSLFGSVLAGADFTGAQVAEVDFGGADLSGVRGFDLAWLNTTRMSGHVERCPDGHPDPTDFWEPDYELALADSGAVSVSEQMSALRPCVWPEYGSVSKDAYDSAAVGEKVGF